MSRWDQLLAVQDLDTQADQLAHRSQTLPVRATLAKLEADGADLDRKLVVVDERLSVLRRSQTRLEDEIALLQEKVVNADKQLYSGTTNSPRELQALQDEITSIKKRIGDLEDEQLEVMEATEPVDAEREELGRRREGLDAEAVRSRAELAETEAEIDQALAGVRERRSQAVAEVPEALVGEYQKLRGVFGGIGVARLVGSTCQGCHLQLSAVEIDRIKHLGPDELVHCEECGRLLVHS
jgi:hypothetical protein